MSEFSTYEYVVAQKKDGALLLKRIGLIFIYICFIIGWFVFGFVSNLFPLLALMPITLWILVFFTWRYVCVEHEYSITSGDMTVSNIYGNRSRKKVTELRLKNCSLIAPVSSHGYKVEHYSPERIYSALSAEDAPDAYFALFEQNGKRCVLYFEATAKSLKICRFYNAPATVMSEVRF